MPKVKGKGSILNASFDGLGTKKNSNEKIDANKKNESDKSVLILISVTGNEYCEGEYLAAIIKDAVEKFRRKVSILIVDDLQKYNLQARKENVDASVLEKAYQGLMENWWKKNEDHLFAIFKIKESDKEYLKSIIDPNKKIEIFNQLAEVYSDMNCTIFNWESWIKHLPNYTEDEIKYVDDFKKDPLVKPLEESALDYAKRKMKGETEFLDKDEKEKYADRLQNLSKAFIKAETLGAIKGALDMGYDYIAYPGDALSVFSVFYSAISANYRDESNQVRSFEYIWLHINFRKKQSKLKANAIQNSSDEMDESQFTNNTASPNISPSLSPSRSPIDEVIFMISEKIIRKNHVNRQELQELIITYKNLKNLQQEQTENNGFTINEPSKNENVEEPKILSNNNYGRFYSAVSRTDLSNSKPVNISNGNSSKPAKPLSRKNKHNSVSSPDVVSNNSCYI